MHCLPLPTLVVFVVFLTHQTRPTHSWGWFSTEEDRPPGISSGHNVAEFSLESVGSQKGANSIEKAKQKMSGPNACWRNAYASLFAGCSEIISNKEKQSRFAWQLSDCFQRDSGRRAFSYCDANRLMATCLKSLDESERSVYIEFYMETNSICHQLQADVFKHETERLVNELKKSAQFTELKLEHIEERSDQILESTNQIDNSLSSIDSRIDQVAKTSREVEEQIDVVLNYSKVIFEQSKEIAASQSDLQGGQMDMREKLEAGMTMLQDSYKNLGQDIEKLRNEAVEIQREIIEISDAMSQKMHNLQNKADDIGNVAGLSLTKQKQLLDGQSSALEGLDFLTKFQSQALEESRTTLKNLAEFGQEQQEELLRRQQQLQHAHDHLVKNSRHILEAQEAFESKQVSMFMVLDKLFALHNSILRESRTIKSFCFYFFAVIILYMLTSTKQTYCVRARLYLGLCGTFVAEFMIVRLGDDPDQQTTIDSKILLARLTFLLLASLQILFSIFTYRDYEVLNHRMLQTLMEKVNTIEKHKLYEEDDISLSAWIDTEVSEDEVSDPTYMIKEEPEVSSTSTSTTKYNLRPRRRY